MKDKKNIGIYVHIPFCDKICNYCDFTAFQGANYKIEEYIMSLIREIRLNSNNSYIVDTIFIGGGTPSFIEGKYIYHIIEEIRKNFILSDKLEISIETNPKTFDKEKLQIYQDCGINRISVGVQSLNDGILRDLGRNHNSKDVLESIDLIRNFLFDLNLDFIFGYERQDFKDIDYDLNMIKKINPEHISYYSLIIEERTKFKSLQKAGKLNLMDEDKERKMYEKIVDALRIMGIFQYEISNFAKVEKKSLHNMKYWKCKEYLGFGLSAHSYVNNTRYSNTVNFSKYIQSLKSNLLPIDFKEELTLKIRKFEYIIMNMRLLEGFLINDFDCIFKADFINENKNAVEEGLRDKIIEIKDGRIFFTNKGLNITDSFFVKMNY